MVHHNKSKRSKTKTILSLPDLKQSKAAVLHSLGAAQRQLEEYGNKMVQLFYTAWRWPERSISNYSARSASIGFTRAARRDGR